MATHDYVIANGTGAAVRSDLNGALAAIVSNNSSATEPATMYAYQWWPDTTTGLLKQRNAANSAWITIGTLASTNLGLLSLAGGTMTGVLAVTAGTAALPGIAVSGDTNTGIYSPGADQLAISTGGTGRITVDASGRVGIGNSAPGGTLDVGAVAGSVTAGDLIVATGSTTASVTVGRISSTGGDSTTFKVRNRVNSTVFVVDGPTERVGIGTTSPSQLLHVKTDQAAYTWARIDNQSSSASAYSGLQLGAFGNSWGIAIGSSAANSNSLTFVTDAGGANSEKARFTSDGKLLVGTSSELPVYYNSASTWNGLLQVARSAQDAVANLSIWNNSASTYATYGGAQIHLSACKSGTVGSHTSGALASGDSIATINFNASDGTNFRNSARIEAVVDGGVSTGDVPGRLVFSTTADGTASPTLRHLIASSGLQRAVSTTHVLEMTTTSSAGTTEWFMQGSYGGTAGSVGTGTASFRVWTNGNVVNTNNSYGAISDVKLKENIVDAGSQWSDIKAFRVRKYNLKGGQKHTQIGGIAQEVELVSPGLVTESPDRDAEGNDLGTVTKSINYSVLYMKAVKALQEAMERIETLEASNADMLARLTALEAA